MVMMNSVNYYNAITEEQHKEQEQGIYGTYDGASKLLALTYSQAIKECKGRETCITYWRSRREEITGEARQV